MSFNRLTDEQLLEAYLTAKRLDIDLEFQSLLLTEIEARNLTSILTKVTLYHEDKKTFYLVMSYDQKKSE
ncbi:sporulation histidine kinase inhibitor Sda [Bacillus pinisoli]|uniref:sporulation histidine kinase inhibitor Sda n=1 Tax=Bacillus pinisoli TaxID=2901866 RepID=UPI001FF5CE76|nr:sporulation histidine kinase inhibitor Sda [Bacillus pinisoli]